MLEWGDRVPAILGGSETSELRRRRPMHRAFCARASPLSPSRRPPPHHLPKVTQHFARCTGVGSKPFSSPPSATHHTGCTSLHRVRLPFLFSSPLKSSDQYVRFPTRLPPSTRSGVPAAAKATAIATATPAPPLRPFGPSSRV